MTQHAESLGWRGGLSWLVAAASLASVCSAGCYESHRLPLSASLPDEWLADLYGHDRLVVAGICERLVAYRERTNCAPDDTGLSWAELENNCVVRGERSADARCLEEWLAWVDCTWAEFEENCEWNVATWSCYDEEAAWRDCL